MASVLHAKEKNKQNAGLIPAAGRPSKIPVWTGYKRGSSSEDADDQTSKIKSSKMCQSLTASRLPVRFDAVPGSRVDAQVMHFSEDVQLTEMKECLSINQARCNQVIEQGLRQVLPAIMKELLAQGDASKDKRGLPKKKQQERPRSNRVANRRTSAQNIHVVRQTSTHSKLPVKACISDSSISDISSLKSELDSDCFISSEPENVPQNGQSESEEENQQQEAGFEHALPSEPLTTVPQHSEEGEESNEADILKYEPDSSWVTEFDLENEELIKQEHDVPNSQDHPLNTFFNHNIDSDGLFNSYEESQPKQAQSDSDKQVSDSQEKTVNAEDLLGTEFRLTHNRNNDSDELLSSDMESLLVNEDLLVDEADKSGDALNDYILRYQPDSSWLIEFDQDIADLIKQQSQSEEDQGVSHEEGEADNDEDPAAHNCKTDVHGLNESNLESQPRQAESDLDEASDEDDNRNNNVCIQEYNYDADVDGVTDSESETLSHQVQMEVAGEEGQESTNGSDRLDLYVNCKKPHQQLHNVNEAFSDEEKNAQEPSHSLWAQNLERKSEVLLDECVLSSGSDPECSMENTDESREEQAPLETGSSSSIGTKLDRFKIETDEILSTDSEDSHVHKDAELKILSDEDDMMKGTSDVKVTLSSDDEISECNQTCEEDADNQREVDLMTKQIEQIIEDLLIMAANESNENKQEPTSSNSTSENGHMSRSSRDGEEASAGQFQGGANIGQGSTAGGSGGDDPNDPKKPKPRKVPEDKKDKDEEMERRIAIKRALINKLMGIATNVLQNEAKGKQPMVKAPTNLAAEKPMKKDDKASQTKQEESVETLLKSVQSKDREIVLLQNLVECCRKDYEELQESFNGYILEFNEVDQLRGLIGAMYTDNSIMRHDNQKIKNQLYHKTREAEHAQEKNKEFQNMIAKLQSDVVSLKSEKAELSKKLKEYAGEEKKDKQGKESESSSLSKTSSLQEAIKIEEENQALKRKLEQCDASEKLTKQKLVQQQLESQIKKLADENKTLSFKCVQFQKQCSEIPVAEIIRDLRRLHEEISEARKDLANDSIADKPKLKGPTLSPLSIELAEADDCTLRTQLEVSPSAEMHTLTYSLTALTEELREQIAQNKVRMAKALCYDNYSELERKSSEKIRELNEEIAELHGKLDEDAEKFKILEDRVTSSHTGSDRLNEWIAELQEELSHSEVTLSKTVEENDKKMKALKTALDLKDQKLEGMMTQHQNLLEANDALRSVIHTLNMNGAASSSRIMELENYLGELESENEKFFKQLCENRTNLNNIQQENEERHAFSREEVEQFHYALQSKTDSLVDILETVNEIAANHPGYHEHPCVSAIENGLQLVHDITGLLKAVGHAYMPKNDPLNEQLEMMVENLQEQNTKLQGDICRLEKELKESKDRYAQDREWEPGKMDEIHLIRKNSSQIMNDVERELRDRQDSELELQEKANALRLKIDKLNAEKRKADKEAKDLRTYSDGKQKNMAEKLLELQKQKQPVAVLEKRQKERSDSEPKLEAKIRSLETRIAQLNAEKAEQEESIQTIMEALNAKKNLEDHLREKEDVEKQLVKKVEELKLKMSRIKLAKKDLRRKLANMHLQHHTSSQGTRNLLQNLKKEVAENSEREKGLHDRIKKLTEERNKAESMLEAQVTLIKKSSEEKMENLEELLRRKGQSELELQEQKTSLEQELVRLEEERAEHTRIISAILRAVKAKQDLAKAFRDKFKLEKDYKSKLDEIERVINKLKTEKRKPNCDLSLKEKYKQKYFELRMIVRKLEDDLYSQNKRIEHLQTVVLAAVEEEDKSGEARETNLRASFEALKNTLNTNHVCEVKLFNTLQSLNSKVLNLENEKAEGEKMMKGLLRSMEESSKTGTDKAFLGLIGEVIDSVHNLRQVKQRIEQDLEDFEKMVATARSEAEVLQNQSFERISGLELSLKEKDISETELKQQMKSMEKTIADMEHEKHNADMAIQGMLESMKSSDELEKLLNQKKEIEKELKEKVLNLEQQNKQNEMQVKFFQQQVVDLEENLKQNTTDASKDLAQQIQMLNTSLASAENDATNYDDHAFKVKFETSSDKPSCSCCLHKIKKITQKLQRENDLEEELRQAIQSLTKEKKELQEEKEAFSEENRSLQLELEAANRREQKLSAEVDELRSENLLSAKNSRKLIDELTRKEKELMKKIDEMEATTRKASTYHDSRDERSLIQEMMAKIAELESKDYEQNAKNKKQQHELISDSKRAKAKIQDLNLSLQQRLQLEDHLKSDIRALNAKLSELSVQMRNEKMKNFEIDKLYSMSKNRIAELERRIVCKQEQIDDMKQSSEELRGQVVRLQEEKDNLANALEDSYHLKLEQRDIQIKRLKDKLEEQEEKMRDNTRRYDDLGQFQGQILTWRGESSGRNLRRGNDIQRNTTKVIIDSLIETEKRISTLKSSWKEFEELQNRSLPYNRNSTAHDSSYYWPSN